MLRVLRTANTVGIGRRPDMCASFIHSRLCCEQELECLEQPLNDEATDVDLDVLRCKLVNLGLRTEFHRAATESRSEADRLV